MNIFVSKLPKIAAQKKKKIFTFFGLLRFSVFFNCLFDPTSRSRMSNIFRDSESLGKSNGKKWSNIWTFLFGSGLKSPLILPWSTLLWHRCYYPHRSRDALSPVCGIFPIILNLAYFAPLNGASRIFPVNFNYPRCLDNSNMIIFWLTSWVPSW